MVYIGQPTQNGGINAARRALIDLAFLKTFVAVVDHGSMAAASRALDLSPSAVAQQLRALEQSLGVRLIVRVGRTARMTDEGSRILDRSRQLLRDSADLRSIAHDGSVGGELRIGSCSTALIGLLPSILAGLTTKYPEIIVHIESDNSVDLYGEIETGNLDAAFVLEAPYLLPKTCDWLLLREEPLIVIAPRPLGTRDPHDLLRNEPFIRYDRNRWGGRGADEYLRDVGIQPKERIEVDLLQSIAVMVDRGLGVSLVPDWAPPWPDHLKLARINLPEVRIGRRVGIVWSRSSVRTRLVDALLDECRYSVVSGSSFGG